MTKYSILLGYIFECKYNGLGLFCNPKWWKEYQNNFRYYGDNS
jgi:hypothetical protein